jgi:hypothetical protein
MSGKAQERPKAECEKECHTKDSFAADNQDEEYTLFGKAIKFAGLHGKEVRVVGHNRETLTTAKAALLQ